MSASKSPSSGPKGRQRKITEAQLRRELKAQRTPQQIADKYGMTAAGVRKRIHELQAVDTAAACKPENNTRAVAQTIDAMAVLNRLLVRAEKLHDACERYLQDPEDPEQYDLRPRAEEIDVTHWRLDPDGKITGKKPEKKSLQYLLDIALDDPDRQLVKVESRHADPRTLLNATSAECRAILAEARALAELLYHGQRMERFMGRVEQAFERVARISPEVAREIADDLRRDLLVHPAFQGPRTLPITG